MPLSFHLRLLAVQLTTAFLLSGVITLINTGYTQGFFSAWAKAWLLTFILLPLVIQSIPFLKARLAQALGLARDSVLFKCIAAFCVALTMETLIAFALTSLQLGWQTGFVRAWMSAIVLALPLGMAIGLTMVFWLEPKIHALVAEGKRRHAQASAQR